LKHLASLGTTETISFSWGITTGDESWFPYQDDRDSMFALSADMIKPRQRGDSVRKNNRHAFPYSAEIAPLE
jgi:hypothetical protein